MSNVKSTSQKSKVNEHVRIRAYRVALKTIKLINTFPNKKAFWSLADQLLRAITSIGANIIEAKSSSSRKEFIKFYEIALKSANESKFWLCLIRDSKIGDQKLVSSILQEVTEISKILASSLLTLKGRK
ncbi:four helix bundle protein [bacterium]|nr:four helix bundle protein [bacterium]